MHLRKPLPSISRFTFGTGRLGVKETDFSEDVKVARAAMEAGVWFHSSSDYNQGRTFDVLRAAFAEAPAQTPRCIIKVYCPTLEQGRSHIEEILRKLPLERIDIAQLCCYADFAPDFREQGPRWQSFHELQERGLVGNYVTEVFERDSTNALEVAQDDLVDAFIFYYNLIDRQVSNQLYDVLRDKGHQMLALRTVGGRFVDFDQIGEARQDTPQDDTVRLLEDLKPLFERSGCVGWVEFNVRFILSVPNMLTTIGATRSLSHLNAFLNAEKSYQPLDATLVEEIIALHRKYFAGFGHNPAPAGQ